MKVKYLIIVLYIVLVGVFGFFYENKNNELKAAPIKVNYTNLDNYYDVDMPVYPEVKEIPVIGEHYINNARAQSSYFVTQESPLNIAYFYMKYWTAQGLKPFKSITPNGGSISVYDYKDHATKTVVIKKETKDKFRVVLTALIDSKMKREFNAFSDIPHSKGSYGFISYESEDENYRASDISYFNPKSLIQNSNFYKKAMVENGWTFNQERSLPKIKISKTLVFSKGRKIAEINLTNNNNNGTIIRLLVKDRTTGLIMKGDKNELR